MGNCTQGLTCSFKGISQSPAFLQSTLPNGMDKDIQKEPWELWGLYLPCTYFITELFGSYSGSPRDTLSSFPLFFFRFFFN